MIDKQTKKAATKAAKQIKKLRKPTKRAIAQIYKQFQAEVDPYAHMP